MDERHGNSSGNTIANLVIIVVILFVVAVIMLPVLFPPHRHSARKTSCQSNLKEIALAFNMYHSDYDNKLPSSALYNSSKTWNRDDFRHFTMELGQIPPPKNASGVKKTLSMLLHCHMASKDILWCPSDPNNPYYKDDHGFWYKLTHKPAPRVKKPEISYWYKAASDYAWFNGCSKEREYEQPADQVIFYEHNSWHWGDEENGFKNGVILNMAYIDGHVSARRISGSAFTTSDIDPAPAKGEPAWYNTCINKKSAAGLLWNPRYCYDDLQ